MIHPPGSLRPKWKCSHGRPGIALMPMLGLLVLLALLTSMLAQRHVRGHRAFQTSARQALARQIASGEAQRILRSIASDVPVQASSRTITSVEVPGLSDPVAIAVTRLDDSVSKYRVEVRIPADAGPSVVRESLEIP
ncbi:hypothetical protein GC170_13350 [bacterium]|nr:hypothetical protein [bacterium]